MLEGKRKDGDEGRDHLRLKYANTITVMMVAIGDRGAEGFHTSMQYHIKLQPPSALKSYPDESCVVLGISRSHSEQFKLIRRNKPAILLVENVASILNRERIARCDLVKMRKYCSE